MKILLAVLLTGVAIYAALWIYGATRWDRMTRELRHSLQASRAPIRPATVTFSELATLPPVVDRYFRKVLEDGQPMIAGVHVRHTGTFNQSETAEQWKPFVSDQQVVTERPGFDWNATIRMMPGVPVRVHDAYVAGEGTLFAALFGAFPVADMRDRDEVARGELMRFAAESPWYPTALLPSQRVRWEDAGPQSARVTFSDSPIQVSLLVAFTNDDLVESVRAEHRGRAVAGQIIPTPWEGRVWNYAVRNGMLVPLDGEVAWLPPEGRKPYWRGHIADIAYEFVAR
jgi:hypothetical protein